MQIYKVINNNMVSIRTSENQEIMLKGLSIGYIKRPGDEVDETKIEKRFVLEDISLIRRFNQMFTEIDKQLIDACIDVTSMIKEKSKTELSDALYVTLLDHVNNLVDRLQQNISFDNSILWDLPRVYPDEYKIAVHAVKLLNEKMPYKIDEDEANFITLHIVNAEKSNDMHKTYQMTGYIEDICDIVASDFNIAFGNTNDYHYNRFVMHLRFLIENIQLHVVLDVQNENGILNTLTDKYPQVWQVVQKISNYIDACMNYKLNDEEKLYLMIHLVQIFTKK